MTQTAKRIYFVRHAESEANEKRVHGGAHHPLTEKGKEQAEFIALRCAKLPLQALAASDMLRAQQTAQVIAAKTGLEVKTVPDLREVEMPSHFLEQRFDTPEALEAEMRLVEGMAPGYRAHDEESFDEIIARAGRVLEAISQLPEQHIGVVTHGLFLRCLIARAIFGPEVSPRELLAVWRGFKSENTGLTILDYRPEVPKAVWRVFVWNDHAHLG